MRRRSAAILAVALLTTACGGSEGPGGDGGGGSAEQEATIEIAGEQANDHGQTDVAGETEAAVETGDVFFSPTVLVGEPGQTLAVSLENTGAVDHTFTIAAQDVDVTLRPGASDTAEVKIPEAGALLFLCRFHAAAGMRGGLSVRGELGAAGGKDAGGGGIGGYDY